MARSDTLDAPPTDNSSHSSFRFHGSPLDEGGGGVCTSMSRVMSGSPAALGKA